LTGDFGGASPKGDIDEGGFLALLAALRAVNAVDCESKLRDGGSFGGVT